MTVATQNFVGGELVDRAGGETETIVNLATGEAIADVPPSFRADVDRAAAGAQKAVPARSTTTPAERSLVLPRHVMVSRS